MKALAKIRQMARAGADRPASSLLKLNIEFDCQCGMFGRVLVPCEPDYDDMEKFRTAVTTALTLFIFAVTLLGNSSPGAVRPHATRQRARAVCDASPVNATAGS
jgi:hypothetical protein